MIAEGKLQLDVVWDGKQLTGVSIRSSRPLAACRILEGKQAPPKPEVPKPDVPQPEAPKPETPSKVHSSEDELGL